MPNDIYPAELYRSKEVNLVEKTEPHYKVGRRQRPVSSDIPHEISQEHRFNGVSSREEPCLPPPLMTVEELALLLRTSKGAVYARRARGCIPGAVRLGRTLRFDPRIIAQWISANSASAGGQP